MTAPPKGLVGTCVLHGEDTHVWFESGDDEALVAALKLLPEVASAHDLLVQAFLAGKLVATACPGSVAADLIQRASAP